MKKREAQQINACHAGPFPAFVKDAEDELEDGEFEVPLEEKVEVPIEEKIEVLLEEKVETPLDEDDEPLEEGNCIYATRLFPEAEQIQVTASISQRLAEGFQQNSTLATFDECIPPHL